MTLTHESRDIEFKNALKESYQFIKKKEFDNAFKSIAKANLFLPPFDDQFNYIDALLQIKEAQVSVISRDKSPDYMAYLIYSLESFALNITRDLIQFPHLSSFYYRKEIKYSPYTFNSTDSEEINFDKDDIQDIALKKLGIFLHREEFYRDYLQFIYEDLLEIYGIPPKYNKDSINKIISNMNTDYESFDQLIFGFSEELHRKSLGYLNYKISEFIDRLIKKYSFI
jgi:hypothetical protein